MKQKMLMIAFLVYAVISSAQIFPVPSSGNIERVEHFKSTYVEARNIDIWLPDGYSSSKKYAVVYMHDGQMLFDAHTTWNNQEWKVDEVFSQLLKEDLIQDCLVVGIWNNGDKRIAEYLPQKVYTSLDSSFREQLSKKYLLGGGSLSDAYLQFIVRELKPYIDTHYSVYSDQAHTFMIGSSMGGIVSIYAMSEYPEVFGGVACMSTAWLSQIGTDGEIPNATSAYLARYLASAKDHSIYMDYGTGESDLEYATAQNQVDSLVRSKGYSNSNYLFRVYDQDIHNEICWSKRLHIPVSFLLKK